jgi:hypothetical protein
MCTNPWHWLWRRDAQHADCAWCSSARVPPAALETGARPVAATRSAFLSKRLPPLEQLAWQHQQLGPPRGRALCDRRRASSVAARSKPACRSRVSSLAVVDEGSQQALGGRRGSVPERRDAGEKVGVVTAHATVLTLCRHRPSSRRLGGRATRGHPLGWPAGAGGGVGPLLSSWRKKESTTAQTARARGE